MLTVCYQRMPNGSRLETSREALACESLIDALTHARDDRDRAQTAMKRADNRGGSDAGLLRIYEQRWQAYEQALAVMYRSLDRLKVKRGF